MGCGWEGWCGCPPRGIPRGSWAAHSPPRAHVAPVGLCVPPVSSRALPGLTCPLWAQVSLRDSQVPRGLLCPLWVHIVLYMLMCPPSDCVSQTGSCVATRSHVAAVGSHVPYRLTSPMGSHVTPWAPMSPWVPMSPHRLLEDPMGPRVLSGTMSATHVLTGTPWVHMSPMGIGVSYRPPCHLEAHVPPTSSPGPYGLTCPSRAPVAPTGSHATPWAPMSPMGSGRPPGALGCPLGHAPHGPSAGWALPDAGGCRNHSSSERHQSHNWDVAPPCRKAPAALAQPSMAPARHQHGTGMPPPCPLGGQGAMR